MTLLLATALGTLQVAPASEPPCDRFERIPDAATGGERLERAGPDWAVTHGPAGTTWSLAFGEPGLHGATVPAGWPVTVVFEEGPVHELRTLAPARPSQLRTKYGGVTHWRVELGVPAHVARDLATRPLDAVTFDLGDGTRTCCEGPRLQRRTAESFACVASRPAP